MATLLSFLLSYHPLQTYVEGKKKTKKTTLNALKKLPTIVLFPI
jgi:hypothetical protein